MEVLNRRFAVSKFDEDSFPCATSLLTKEEIVKIKASLSTALSESSKAEKKMKLTHVIPALVVAQTAQGFTTNPVFQVLRPATENPCGALAVRSQFDCRWGEEDLGKAFNDLEEEIKRDRRRAYNARRNGRRWRQHAANRRHPSSMWENDEVGRETFRKRQKEWINKAFDLASDLNENFGSSKKEIQDNDEAIQNMQEFFNRVLNDREDFEESTVESNENSYSDSTPRYQVYDTDDKFQVFMDVPGVEKSDIEISLNEDDDMLTISGRRFFHFEKSSEDDEPSPQSIEFSRTFGPLEEIVETENLTAKLENGVLVVTAPKKPKEQEAKISKNIPIL